MTLSLDSEQEKPALADQDDTPERFWLGARIANRCGAQSMNCRCISGKVLLLCEVEDMSYPEIAETLSIPLGTVMSRARKTLGDALQLQFKKG